MAMAMAMGVLFFSNLQHLITTTTIPFSSHQNHLHLQSNHFNTSKSSTTSSSKRSTITNNSSKFVPINYEDPSYGPPALLLLGFQPEEEEASQIHQLLKDLDGEFMRIIYCTETMLSDSLWNALHTKHPNTLQHLKIVNSSLPRICFLSGLTGEETLMFIHAFQESGVEAAVFAALVPNNAHTPLQELIQEIMGDHEATMSAEQSSSP